MIRSITCFFRAFSIGATLFDSAVDIAPLENAQGFRI